METEDYFEGIEQRTSRAYEIAEEARSQSKDPENRVDIPVATDLPEKASSLVTAAMFPELEDAGVADRIRELEDRYGKNDERVAFSIAEEVAVGEFHDFDSRERACSAGIRIGVSYMTGGITTAPLEGIGDIRIKENGDGTEYLAVYYSGPIRSAGGTASAMSVMLADYVRSSVGLDRFKPPEEVVKRYATEVDDYYNRVTAKQYYPEREETEMIAGNVPVEVTGSPTEQKDVSNYKDLDAVETNRIRGGMCLVYLDGLPLKAPKIKKRLEEWGEEFGLEHWSWVNDYIELQEEIHSSGSGDEDEPDYTPSDKYLESITAGRPVLGHPEEKGGFRLRYGHSRSNGLAAASFHPATMEITERFAAIGTQLKTEYPMKATVATSCDSIHPPVVRLKDGTVTRVESRQEARDLEPEVDEILFLGDILITYGEFMENGKDLLPSPYVHEWWIKEVEEACREKDIRLGKDFTGRKPTPREAFTISEKLGVPLHPRWTYHWTETSHENFRELVEWFHGRELTDGAKKAMEEILLPHRLEDGEAVLDGDDEAVLERLLSDLEPSGVDEEKEIPSIIGEASGVELREQAPHYIGARMGRPEKAEKRTLQGRPQLLFPCGREEGGRMRNLAESYRSGTVEEEIVHNRCTECGDTSFYSYCIDCGTPAEPLWFCSGCGDEYRSGEPEECSSCGEENFNRYRSTEIDVEKLLDHAMENLGAELPELLKSPRGMSGEHRHVEPIEKGLIRQKYGLYVNKDGTVRYDATDLPLTHFKPREISTPVEKLKELGYERDVHGNELRDEDQVLALKPQDIVIPDNEQSMPASEYLLRTACFVDELLEELYGLDPYYRAEKKQDLVGKLVIGLAPHTSGGTVGRIIGFTGAKGVYAHPYWHAAKRRNADGDEDALMLLMDGLLNFSRKFLPNITGAKTMDAPLILSTVLNADEIDDEAWNIETVGEYPLEFYRETQEYPKPWELGCDITVGEEVVDTGEPYRHGFTHENGDIENGPKQSEYVTLDDMGEKTAHQLGLGEKIRAVDEDDVADLLLKKHFIPDIKGNLRSFSSQDMRCGDCNTKFRRVPITQQTIAASGKTTAECPECGGGILLTISEGTIKKYLRPSEEIIDNYGVSPYVRQQIMILKETLQSLFGKEKRQTGIKQFTA